MLSRLVLQVAMQLALKNSWMDLVRREGIRGSTGQEDWGTEK